jgi:hypothetical protein
VRAARSLGLIAPDPAPLRDAREREWTKHGGVRRFSGPVLR